MSNKTEEEIALRLWSLRYYIPKSQVSVKEVNELLSQQQMLQKYASQKAPNKENK
jgi:hypothetical protein